MQKDIMLWKGLIFLAFSIALLNACDGRRLQRANHKKSRDALCSRSHTFNNEEACNTRRNCKFGGICRKVADFKTPKATLRVIVPSHDDNTDPLHHGVRRRATSRYSLSSRIGQSSSDECVCSFSCGRRFSQTGTQLQVCGSNGKTYPSECHLKREACRCQTNITIENYGSCQKEIKSVFDVEPNNSKKDDISQDCSDECKFGSSCDDNGKCRCSIECFAQTLSYVCGEDGRTYSNECHVKQAECRKQKKIGILHTGPCSGEEKKRRENEEASEGRQTTNLCDTTNCNDSYPLCGDDGISYPNECVLKHASCIKGKNIEIKHEGYCRHIEDTELMPTYLEPVYSKSTSGDHDPCVNIFCTNGAVCVKHDEYGHICSCEEICNRMVSDTYTNNSFVSSFRESPAMAAFWPSDRTMFEKPTMTLDENLYIAKTFREDGTLEDEDRSYFTSTAASVTIVPEEEPRHDIIKLDLEKEIKEIMGRKDGDRDMLNQQRPKKRRNRKRRRGERRKSRTRTKRSVIGMRQLYEDAVCGTDGKTYDNECELRKEACRSEIRIVMAHRGACPMMLKTTQSTTPVTISKTITSVLQERDEIVNIDDMKGLDFMNKTTTKRNSKNKKNPNRKKGNRNRDKKKSTNQNKLDTVIEERDETVNSSIILGNFDPPVYSSLSPVAQMNTTELDLSNVDTSTPSNKIPISKTKVTVDRYSLVSAQTTTTTTQTMGDNLSPDRMNLINTNISVADVTLRSQRVNVKNYQSLWKPSKKQKIFRNSVKLAKIAHNRTDEANNDSIRTPSKSDSGISVVVLGIVIGLGQVFVIGILVGIFIYMKKRKKLKDITDTKVKADKKTEETQNLKNNNST